VRVEIEVAEDGQTLTATYTLEFTGEGFPEGEIGPGMAEGVRIAVEPMGTPVMSPSEAFGGEDAQEANEEAGATPES
jgi:hypothetical protein